MKSRGSYPEQLYCNRLDTLILTLYSACLENSYAHEVIWLSFIGLYLFQKKEIYFSLQKQLSAFLSSHTTLILSDYHLNHLTQRFLHLYASSLLHQRA